MKKIFCYICAAVLSLGLISCAKDAVDSEVRGQMMLDAKIDDGCSTKATLSGDDQTGYKVLWDKGDEIFLVKLSNVSITAVFKLSEGAGSTSATFVGESLADGDYTAYYAYNREEPLKFGEQTSFSEQSVSNAPMTANFTVRDGIPSALVFKNACGLLRLNLKGAGTVNSIKITTNEPLVSHYDNFLEDGSMGVPNPKGNPALKYITLDCVPSGRKLSESYRSFYIAMPPGDYTGVKIEVRDFADHTFTKTLKADKTLNIVRAQITTAALTVSGLTNDNVPLTKDSPEGTIGMLEGRECMAVDLGGSFGKVAIATRNVDLSKPTKEASSPTEAGSYLNFFDAGTSMGDTAWYVPSMDEFKALVQIPNSHVGSCQEWVIGTGENQHKLYFRWAGMYTYVNYAWEFAGGIAVWSSTSKNSDQAYYLGDFGSSRVDARYIGVKTGRRSVRLFHKLD